MKNNSQGFTLIELLIVIAIIGILAAVLIPNLLAARNRANDSAAQTYVRQCVTAIETARNSVTQQLPSTATGVIACEDTDLGSAALVAPAALKKAYNGGTTASVVTLNLLTDRYTIEVTSVTNKKYGYDGTRVRETTTVALPTP